MADLINFNVGYFGISRFFHIFAERYVMEELHQIGLRNKTILVKFLKEKKLLGDFIGNYMIEAKKHRIYVNDIFNNYQLRDLFGSFLHLTSISYPKNINGVFKKIDFWHKINEEWKSFVYYQKYKEYDIW